MTSRKIGLVFGAALVALGFGAAKAPAASLMTGAFAGPSVDGGNGVDEQFNTACGGSDNFGCEYTVAEGRIGDGTGAGSQELILFDRLSGSGAVAGAGANAATGDATGAFTLTYTAATPSLMLSMLGTDAAFGIDLGAIPAGPNNPDAAPSSLVLRVRDASLTGLELISDLGTETLPDVAEIQQLDQSDVGYLYIGGFDLTADWTLSGLFAFDPDASGSGSAFQAKVTDLEVPQAPIPLPAGFALLAGALGALGAGRVLRRR